MTENQNNINRIIKSCTSRWGGIDSKVEKFKNYFSDWILLFPDELRSLMTRFVEQFDYYPKTEVFKIFQYFNEKLKNEYDLTDTDATIYTHIPSKSGESNSSDDYIRDYRIQFRIPNSRVIQDLGCYLEKPGHKVSNIVIIDDCCGSGKTINDFMKMYKTLLTGKSIYYLVVHAMEESFENIKEASQQLGINIQVIWFCRRSKAFLTPNPPVPIGNIRAKFEKYSLSIGHNKKFSFGFEGTESLVSFYNNTPNGTLAVFWRDSDIHPPIFPRGVEDFPDLSPSGMRKRKLVIKSQFYYAKVRKNFYDGTNN